MKTIRIKIIDLKPMTVKEAKDLGYKIDNKLNNEQGYEVTYDSNYKSWIPKDVVDKYYFKLSNENNIIKKMFLNFIRSIDGQTINDKTTLVNNKLIINYNIIETSSCVDHKNYNLELSKKYIIEKKVINKV